MDVDLDKVRVGTQFTKTSQIFTQDMKKCIPVVLNCEITEIGFNDQAKTYKWKTIEQHPPLVDNQRVPCGGSLFSKYFMDMTWLSAEY